MSLLTTVLDLVGALLLIVAIALWVAVWSLPAGIAIAGVGLLVLSWLVDRRGRPRKVRR